MAEWTNKDIIYISAEAVVGFVTVTGNCIVLVAIVWTKSLHTITNVFIGNLAIADIAVGIFVAPCAALSFLGLPGNKYGCIFINCAILMFTNISILMLLTIAVERFIAIRFPFIYKRHATVKTAVLVNLSIWVVGSILGLLPMFGWNIAPDDLSTCSFTDVISMEYMVYFQFFAITLSPLFIMFIIYLYIFFTVRHHTKQTRALEKLFRDPQNSSRNRRRWDKDVQAAKMFALLFFLFALFWLPINIMNSITLFCPACRSPYELLLTAIVLSHANSSINPFLYATNNSKITIAIKKMFSMKTTQENQFDSNSHGQTSYAENKNNTSPQAKLRSVASKENGLQISNDAQILNAENADDDLSNKTTKVSFVREPHFIDPTNEVAVNVHRLNGNSAERGQSSRKTSHILSQTHSFRDEIDNHILDRLTPLEGIMANIYNSLDSETKDIIENRENDGDKNTQNNIETSEMNKTIQQNGNTNNDLRPSSPTTKSGHVNYAFVEDIETCDYPEEGFANENISHIKTQESNRHNICIDPFLSHSNTNSNRSKPNPTPKLLRSPNVETKDELSSPSSHDSTVNVVNDVYPGHFSVSMGAELSVMPQTDSTHMYGTNSLTNPSTMNRGPLSQPRPTMFQDNLFSTQNLLVMDPENDESIMSIKFFKESQEAISNGDMTNDSNPESRFDNFGMLRNLSTESTHL